MYFPRPPIDGAWRINIKITWSMIKKFHGDLVHICKTFNLLQVPGGRSRDSHTYMFQHEHNFRWGGGEKNCHHGFGLGIRKYHGNERLEATSYTNLEDFVREMERLHYNMSISYTNVPHIWLFVLTFLLPLHIQTCHLSHYIFFIQFNPTTSHIEKSNYTFLHHQTMISIFCLWHSCAICST